MALTPEQIEQRRHLLTASDASAVLGLNPWRTPHDVWAEKMGTVEPWAGNWKTRRGEVIEPLLLAWLAEKKAPLVVKPSGATTLVHPILSWLGATPDAMISEVDGAPPVAIGEAKSTGMHDDWLDENENPVVPEYYAVQVIVQMAVCRVPRAEVAVEILGEREPWIIPVERNEEDELAVLEELERFWRDHVLAKVPPSLDDASYRQVATVYRRPRDHGFAPWTPEAEALARRYLKAAEIRKRADDAAEAAKTELCKLIAAAEGIGGEGWRCTWKERPAVQLAYERKAYRHFDLRTVKPKGRGA